MFFPTLLTQLFFYIFMSSISMGNPTSRPPASPCPHIFVYQRNQAPGDIYFPGRDNSYWKAVVMIPSHILSSGDDLHLALIMSVPGVLPTKYVGRIEFLGDKQALARGSMEIAKFDVHFPSNVPVPSVVRISVNDHTLCNGAPAQAPVVTKLIIQHSLFLSRMNLTAAHRRHSDISDLRSNIAPSPCGTFSRGNPLVVNGEPTSAGEWPWLVPIYSATRDGRSVQFLCAGTLISSRHIVTAAHCFREISTPDELVAYVGRRKISNWADRESQPRGVKQLIIHPDFTSSDLYSDIAVIELSEPVKWTKTVSPVCLWNAAPDLDYIIGKRGTVVGWGTDDAGRVGVTSEPQSTELPIVSQEACLRSSLEFHYFASNRTLCAGARDGTGPCNGDSGGGLYLPFRVAGGGVRWHLRGIVSMSLRNRETLLCDLRHYTIFTDVAQFKPWLSEILAPAG